MASTHVNKKMRKPWNEENMEKAILAVRLGELSQRKATMKFKVPRSSLQRLVMSDLEPKKAAIFRIGRKPVFEASLEEEFVQHVLKLKDESQKLKKQDLNKMAYEFAGKHNLQKKFGSTKMIAGRRWLRRFLQRHKGIVDYAKTPTRKIPPKKLEQVDQDSINFSETLEYYYNLHQFPANRIFNIGVMGLIAVSNRNPIFVTCKNDKEMSDLTPDEKRGLMTIVVSMSASGFFVPPMLIFPEEMMKDELMDGSPYCSIGAANPSGRIQSHLSGQWLAHFIKKVRPSEHSPVLLISDGQDSHTRNLEMMTSAEENHIQIVSVPPSLRETQPLIRTFMKPMKDLYSKELKNWVSQNDRDLESSDLARIFGRAYLKIRKREVAVNGFRSTGIHPLDETILLNLAETETGSTNDVRETTSRSFPKIKILL